MSAWRETPQYAGEPSPGRGEPHLLWRIGPSGLQVVQRPEDTDQAAQRPQGTDQVVQRPEETDLDLPYSVIADFESSPSIGLQSQDMELAVIDPCLDTLPYSTGHSSKMSMKASAVVTTSPHSYGSSSASDGSGPIVQLDGFGSPPQKKSRNQKSSKDGGKSGQHRSSSYASTKSRSNRDGDTVPLEKRVPEYKPRKPTATYEPLTVDDDKFPQYVEDVVAACRKAMVMTEPDDDYVFDPHEILEDVNDHGEPITHEELARRCFNNNWADNLMPKNVGRPVNYEEVRAAQGNSIATELAISSHAHLTAMVEALRGHAKQVNDMKLLNLICVEKLALLEGRLCASGFREEGKKVVSRVMAAHNLRSGRVVPGIPLRTNEAILAVFTDTAHVQKIATVILAHIPFKRNTFPYDVRDLLLHPNYVRDHYWCKSKHDRDRPVVPDVFKRFMAAIVQSASEGKEKNKIDALNNQFRRMFHQDVRTRHDQGADDPPAKLEAHEANDGSVVDTGDDYDDVLDEADDDEEVTQPNRRGTQRRMSTAGADPSKRGKAYASRDAYASAPAGVAPEHGFVREPKDDRMYAAARGRGDHVNRHASSNPNPNQHLLAVCNAHDSPPKAPSTYTTSKTAIPVTMTVNAAGGQQVSTAMRLNASGQQVPVLVTAGQPPPTVTYSVRPTTAPPSAYNAVTASAMSPSLRNVAFSAQAGLQHVRAPIHFQAGQQKRVILASKQQLQRLPAATEEASVSSQTAATKPLLQAQQPAQQPQNVQVQVQVPRHAAGALTQQQQTQETVQGYAPAGGLPPQVETPVIQAGAAFSGLAGGVVAHQSTLHGNATLASGVPVHGSPAVQVQGSFGQPGLQTMSAQGVPPVKTTINSTTSSHAGGDNSSQPLDPLHDRDGADRRAAAQPAPVGQPDPPLLTLHVPGPADTSYVVPVSQELLTAAAEPSGSQEILFSFVPENQSPGSNGSQHQLVGSQSSGTSVSSVGRNPESGDKGSRGQTEGAIAAANLLQSQRLDSDKENYTFM